MAPGDEAVHEAKTTGINQHSTSHPGCPVGLENTPLNTNRSILNQNASSTPGRNVVPEIAVPDDHLTHSDTANTPSAPFSAIPTVYQGPVNPRSRCSNYHWPFHVWPIFFRLPYQSHIFYPISQVYLPLVFVSGKSSIQGNTLLERILSS